MKLIKLNVQDRPLHLLQRSPSESYFALREVDVSLLRPNAVFPSDVKPRFAFIPNCNEAAKRAYIRQACRELGIGLPDASRDELELLRHAQCLPARAPKASLIGIAEALALLEGFGMAAATRALTHTLAHTMVVDAHGVLAPLCQRSSAENSGAQPSEPRDYFRFRHSGRADESALAGGVGCGWCGTGTDADTGTGTGLGLGLGVASAQVQPHGPMPGSWLGTTGSFSEARVGTVCHADAAPDARSCTHGQGSTGGAWSGGDAAACTASWPPCGPSPHMQHLQPPTAGPTCTPLPVLNTLRPPLFSAYTSAHTSATEVPVRVTADSAEAPGCATRCAIVPLEQEQALDSCADVRQAAGSAAQTRAGGLVLPLALTPRTPRTPSAQALPQLSPTAAQLVAMNKQALAAGDTRGYAPSDRLVGVQAGHSQWLPDADESHSMVAHAAPHAAPHAAQLDSYLGAAVAGVAGVCAGCCEAKVEWEPGEELGAEDERKDNEAGVIAHSHAFEPFSGAACGAQEYILGTDDHGPERIRARDFLSPNLPGRAGLSPGGPSPGVAVAPFQLCLNPGSPGAPGRCNHLGASVHAYSSAPTLTASPADVAMDAEVAEVAVAMALGDVKPLTQRFSSTGVYGHDGDGDGDGGGDDSQHLSRHAPDTATQAASVKHAPRPHPSESQSADGDVKCDVKCVPEVAVVGPRKRGRGRPAGSLNRPYLGLGGVPPVLGKRARVRAKPPLWAAVLAEECREPVGDNQPASASAGPPPRAARPDVCGEAVYSLGLRVPGPAHTKAHQLGHHHLGPHLRHAQERGTAARTRAREGPCTSLARAGASQMGPDSGGTDMSAEWSPYRGQRFAYVPNDVDVAKSAGWENSTWQAQTSRASASASAYASPQPCRGHYNGPGSDTDGTPCLASLASQAALRLQHHPQQLHRARTPFTGSVHSVLRCAPCPPSITNTTGTAGTAGTAAPPQQASTALLAAHALLSPVSHSGADVHPYGPEHARTYWSAAAIAGPRDEECPLALGARAVAALLSPAPVRTCAEPDVTGSVVGGVVGGDSNTTAAAWCVQPRAPLYAPPYRARVSHETTERPNAIHAAPAGAGVSAHRAPRQGGAGSASGGAAARRTRDRTRFAGCVFESLVVADGVVVRRSAGVFPAWRARGRSELNGSPPLVQEPPEDTSAFRAGDPQHAARQLIN